MPAILRILLPVVFVVTIGGLAFSYFSQKTKTVPRNKLELESQVPPFRLVPGDLSYISELESATQSGQLYKVIIVPTPTFNDSTTISTSSGQVLASHTVSNTDGRTTVEVYLSKEILKDLKISSEEISYRFLLMAKRTLKSSYFLGFLDTNLLNKVAELSLNDQLPIQIVKSTP